jgi:hypothetical protein
LTLRRREGGDGRSRTDIFLVASEVLVRLSYIPELIERECGRVESNHHSEKPQGYGLLSSPMLGVRLAEGGRPDSNRYREDHDLGCCRYTTATIERGRPDSNRRPLA